MGGALDALPPRPPRAGSPAYAAGGEAGGQWKRSCVSSVAATASGGSAPQSAAPRKESSTYPAGTPFAPSAPMWISRNAPPPPLLPPPPFHVEVRLRPQIVL